MDRRAFVVNVVTTLAVGQSLLADAHQTRPEVPTLLGRRAPGRDALGPRGVYIAGTG